jgi:hypothetical protein
MLLRSILGKYVRCDGGRWMEHAQDCIHWRFKSIICIGILGFIYHQS